MFITHGIDEAVVLGQRVAVMTSRPGRIKQVVEIPEALRSEAEDVRSLPEFGAVRHEIWTLLREEVLEGAATGGGAGAARVQPRCRRSCPCLALRSLTLLGSQPGTADVGGAGRAQPSPVLARPPGLRSVACVGQRSLLLLALLALWELAPRLGLVDGLFLPPFSEVLAAGWQLAQAASSTSDVAASLLRALAGFCIAVVLIVPLGLAIGWYARLGNLLNQFIEICRNTAPLALLPVFILLLGIGELSKIAMVVYSCAWPLLLNTIAAVKQVDPLLIKSARTMGATPAAAVPQGHPAGFAAHHLRRHSSGQCRRPCWCWSPPRWSAPRRGSAI